VCGILFGFSDEQSSTNFLNSFALAAVVEILYLKEEAKIG